MIEKLQIVDRLSERVGHFAAVAGHELLRLAARAREEAEDIWAEAQSLRRGERPEEPVASERRAERE